MRDASVIGRVAGSKPGAKVLVLRGDDGVYAIKINGNKKENFKYDAKNYARQFQQAVQPNYPKMLKSGKGYKNQVYRFEAGEYQPARNTHKKECFPGSAPFSYI